MDVKILRVVISGINNTQEAIRRLAWEDYPYGNCKDADLYEMFYQLNSLALKLYEKIHELEGTTNDQRES